jgi:hypothetical protein
MKRILIGTLAAIGAVFVAIFIFAVLASTGDLATRPDSYHVMYELTGVGDASITIENESGGTEQHTVSLPWYKNFDARCGQFLYLSAQNDGYRFGELKATIYVDGHAIQNAETTEQYGIASVSGRAR